MQREDLLAHINMVKVLVDQLRSIEVKIEDENVYMVFFINLSPFFDNLVMNLESMSIKDVDFQFIIARLLHKVSKRKENESMENVALLNKIHKANKKLCFYCKKPEHFVRNCLKKKSDEKEKVNQACEDQEQMFVAILGVNDHAMYDWIIDFGATQHMTFERVHHL
jgi:succinate dehydrogenase flavin-adding protein (antitoxin of CptAB toxin-antitoxin module)